MIGNNKLVESIARASRHRKLKGTIVEVTGDMCTVSYAGARIFGVKIIGGYPVAGEEVQLGWNGYEVTVSRPERGLEPGSTITSQSTVIAKSNIPQTGAWELGSWSVSESGVISHDGGNYRIDPTKPSMELGNAVAFLSGAGIWMGKDLSIYKMHVGDPAGQHWYWDGTTLEVNGNIVGNVSGTDSNSFTLNQDREDTDVSLVFGRTTGGDATIRYAGTGFFFDKPIGVGASPTADKRIFSQLVNTTVASNTWAILGNNYGRIASASIVGVAGYAYADQAYAVGPMYGLYGSASGSSTGGSATAISGVQSLAALSNTHNANNLYGGFFQVTIAGTGTVAQGVYGAYIKYLRSGSTVPPSSYGLYIEAITGATNNYSLVTNAGTAIFNSASDANSNFIVRGGGVSNLFYVNASLDKVGLNDNTPYYLLDVNGEIRAVSGLRIGSGDPTNHVINISSGNLLINSSSGHIHTGWGHYLTMANGTGGDSIKIAGGTAYGYGILSIQPVMISEVDWTAPEAMLTIRRTSTPHIKIAYDPTNFVDLYTSSGGNFVVSPYGDFIFDSANNPGIGIDVLPSAGYETNLGSLPKKYLTLHAAELWVETLVAQNTIATIGGRILVGHTTPLITDLASGGADPGYIQVKYNNLGNVTGEEGAIIYLEANGQLEFMQILLHDTPDSGKVYKTVIGGYEYKVDRNLDATGQNNWWAGDAVFNTGKTGAGFIDIYSINSFKHGYTQNGPTIVGNIRNSATYNDWSESWAIGNLGGLYGKSSGTYGIGLGRYSIDEYLVITSTGIEMFDDTDTRYLHLGDPGTGFGLYLGVTAAEHILITSTGVQIKDGSTVYTSLVAGALTLGSTSTEHVNITSTAVQIKDGSTVYTDLTASVLTLGNAAAENVVINTTGVLLRDVSTVYAQFAATTTVGVVSGGEYVSIASTGVDIYGGGNPVIRLDSLGNATFGRVATNYGNAYWNASNQRLEFRGGTNGTAISLYIDSNGSLNVNDGTLYIDSGGINLVGNDIASSPIKFRSGGTLIGYIYENVSGGANTIHLIAIDNASNYGAVSLDANGVGSYPYARIMALGGSSTTSAQAVLYAGGAAWDLVVKDAKTEIRGSLGVGAGLSVGDNTVAPTGGEIRMYADSSPVSLLESTTYSNLEIRSGANSSNYLRIGYQDATWCRYDTASGNHYFHQPVVVNGDIRTYNFSWASWYTSMTYSGWSAKPTGSIYYKKVGKLVFVSFSLTGTSNATTHYITLPSNADTSMNFNYSIHINNNGTWITGLGQIGTASSGRLYLYADGAPTTLSASGTVAFYGTIIYEEA